MAPVMPNCNVSACWVGSEPQHQTGLHVRMRCICQLMISVVTDLCTAWLELKLWAAPTLSGVVAAAFTAAAHTHLVADFAQLLFMCWAAREDLAVHVWLWIGLVVASPHSSWCMRDALYPGCDGLVPPEHYVLLFDSARQHLGTQLFPSRMDLVVVSAEALQAVMHSNLFLPSRLAVCVVMEHVRLCSLKYNGPLEGHRWHGLLV